MSDCFGVNRRITGRDHCHLAMKGETSTTPIEELCCIIVGDQFESLLSPSLLVFSLYAINKKVWLWETWPAYKISPCVRSGVIKKITAITHLGVLSRELTVFSMWNFEKSLFFMKRRPLSLSRTVFLALRSQAVWYRWVPLYGQSEFPDNSKSLVHSSPVSALICPLNLKFA